MLLTRFNVEFLDTLMIYELFLILYIFTPNRFLSKGTISNIAHWNFIQRKFMLKKLIPVTAVLWLKYSIRIMIMLYNVLHANEFRKEI